VTGMSDIHGRDTSSAIRAPAARLSCSSGMSGMFIKNKKQNQSYGSLAPAVPFLFSANPAIPDIPVATLVCLRLVLDDAHWTNKPPNPPMSATVGHPMVIWCDVGIPVLVI
jgi:hypothetical protein